MQRRDWIKWSSLAGLTLLTNPEKLFAQMPMLNMKASDFGNDFLWGVATAAYQIEGAWNVDGKGPSVWDTFTHNPKNIMDKSNGDVSIDFYHKYKDDIKLLSELGFKVFRFSISWSRIFPEGTKYVNKKGVDFYHNVIDECLKYGIQPWITLYHWDLPQALEDKGGWTNRAVIDWFSEYVDFCTKEYGSKVKNWMIFNEPLAFTALGYLGGMHAPGKRGFKKFLATVHHVTMCQAEGGRIVRRNVSDARVGTTFSVTAVEPKKKGVKRHETAARKADAFFNRLFVEPTLGMGYPVDGLPFLKKLEKYMQPGDKEKMAFDFDFFGLQNYFRSVARFSLWPPVMWANVVKAKKLVNDESELTEMGWEVSPDGIYRVLKQFGAYKKPIIVTENGAAFADVLESDGSVHDERRTQFFKDYLQNVLLAKQEGVDIQGYYLWTFIDNFEWAEGYHPRFGIVYNDHETQQRYVKDSGKWWQQFLRS